MKFLLNNIKKREDLGEKEHKENNTIHGTLFTLELKIFYFPWKHPFLKSPVQNNGSFKIDHISISQ